ncbi:hypothetical protein GYB57_02920 [bacterium]|nr:hypothetical protein [bacterium]
MKVISFSILFLLISQVCFCDTLNLREFDYSKADSLALSLTKHFKSVDKLAQELTKDLETEHEKYRAIFRWVTNNISYNIANKNTDPKYTLKKQSALCAGYSNLILELCSSSNIKCKSINGYAKSFAKHIGKFNKINHSWNVVNLNGTWYISDATWAAGHVNGRRFTKEYDNFYFLSDPEQIKYNHFPEDNEWFLTENSFKLKMFEKLPIIKPPYFDLGITPEKELDGIIKNKLKFRFQSNQEIYRASLKFDREKEFRPIFIEKDEDGFYMIDMEFDDYIKGPCWLFFNGDAVMVFVKK